MTTAISVPAKPINGLLPLHKFNGIYPLFPYKYLLFPAHSIFIVSGNSHAIIKENLKCDKCFLYDRIRS
jgi:hypothetical protein